MSSTDPVKPVEKEEAAPIATTPIAGSTAPDAVPAEKDATPERAVSPTPTIKPTENQARQETTAERAFQLGLSPKALEEEVGQVLGSLNSWWGGVKKQSAVALSSIKSEVDKTVSQAQADLEYLRTAKVEIIRKDNSTPKDLPKEESQPIASSSKGKEKAWDETPTPSTAKSDSTPMTTIFDRLSSSTTQIQNTLQNTFQSTIAASNQMNAKEIRTQLAENLRLSSAKENLQMSMKQAEKLAEEYMKKGDQWVKDAEKWVGDNVKVVPPDDDSRYISTSWDGGDFYSFSTSPNTEEKQSTPTAQKRSSATAPIAGSRKEALMRRLREDETLLLVDPEGENETAERRDAFKNWVKEKYEVAHKEEKEKEMGNVGEIRMALVPETLTDEQFWQRYLFHKHMIEAEEEKRKRVLEATETVQQDDFSWDDEPEETTPPAGPPKLASSEVATPKIAQGPSADVALAPTPSSPALVAPPVVKSLTSASTSPRDSEESYDLVSDQGKGVKASTTEDDEDSDWE